MFEAVHRWQQGRYTCVLENEINQMIVSAQLSIMGTCIHHCSPVGGGGGQDVKGYRLRSDRCGGRREVAKKGGAVPSLYCMIRELSESLHPIL